MMESRNPAKSRPLSANVKRLMWLERTSPCNQNIMQAERQFTENDKIYCHKQGQLFMEAAAMGFSMQDFAPKFMTSQLAGVIDYSLSSSNGVEADSLSGLLKIPVLFEEPKTLVESLYWIDDIISGAADGENKSLVLSKAYESDSQHIPQALLQLPEEENKSLDDLSYAYWLGYIYRCECLLHDESSRMIYGAFEEFTMNDAYQKFIQSPLNDEDISENAKDVCAELDRMLIEQIWKNKKFK